MKTIKDNFYNIKKAWVEATKSPKAKRTLVRGENGYCHITKGWIRAEHHILYNIIRGKNPYNGFENINGDISDGYYNALEVLKWFTTSQFANHDKFLAPFGSELTKDMFMSLSDQIKGSK